MLAYRFVNNHTNLQDSSKAQEINLEPELYPGEKHATTSGLVRSVSRAMNILALLNEETPAISVSEAVKATRLPKTTVLRLLQTLDECGLLWVSEGRYHPGPTLLRLVNIASDSWILPPNTQALMKSIAEETGETVNFYVRKGLKRVCIAQVQGPQGLRHVLNVGDELPLWAGASAKILLTTTPPNLLVEVAKSSPNGESHLKTLENWIDQVNERGWAESHAEREDGISAVAVPVHMPQSRELLAMSVSGPSSRFTQSKVFEIVEILKRSAGELTHFKSPDSSSQ